MSRFVIVTFERLGIPLHPLVPSKSLLGVRILHVPAGQGISKLVLRLTLARRRGATADASAAESGRGCLREVQRGPAATGTVITTGSGSDTGASAGAGGGFRATDLVGGRFLVGAKALGPQGSRLAAAGNDSNWPAVMLGKKLGVVHVVRSGRLRRGKGRNEKMSHLGSRLKVTVSQLDLIQPGVAGDCSIASIFRYPRKEKHSHAVAADAKPSFRHVVPPLTVLKWRGLNLIIGVSKRRRVESKRVKDLGK
ncbi:hypothetical protein GGX14DRAFT_678015 [Mycena pura]|uniref:Uncharacterized protein n=1 Tax=Mycena pura TaxID=153505 RepID=A0AAD6UUS9_9AGAR|nr:hypothetical protein GGX14DRAFT_678015 [Mycena pura]